MMRKRFALALFAWSLASMAEAGPMDPPDTSRWKTYRNTEYGFTFQYPPDWTVREKYAFPGKSIFSGTVQSGRFWVTLLHKGKYSGVSVVVRKNTDLLFHSKAITGFFRYEPALNAWLAYNPAVHAKESRIEPYYLPGRLLCEAVQRLGLTDIPVYGTTGLVHEEQPKNDLILTNRPFAIMIPREDPGQMDTFLDADWGVQEAVRNSFRLTGGTRAREATCAPDWRLSEGALPEIARPAMDQAVAVNDSLPFRFSKPVPDGMGAAVFLLASDLPFMDALLFETPLLDVAKGSGGTIRFRDVSLLDANSEAGKMWLHAYFYRNVNGRKVFLGEGYRRVAGIRLTARDPSASAAGPPVGD